MEAEEGEEESELTATVACTDFPFAVFVMVKLLPQYFDTLPRSPYCLEG